MTTERPIITAYCLEWHMTSSGSMHDLLIHPLAPYAEIRQVAWTGQEELPAPKPGEVLIFYMLPPTDAWLERYRQHDFQLVWIPMADAITYTENMKKHPSIRVVTFSSATQAFADMLHLQSFPTRYYPNPERFSVAEFKSGRVMLYWNRTGFFHKRLITRLCRELRLQRLIFRDVLDPRIEPSKRYILPPKIGKTIIETHNDFTSYEAYLALLDRANIFIAPRKLEGVGLAFLEAMARGCCVIGYNDVAMNEYIIDGINGLLISPIGKTNTWQQRTSRLVNRIINKIMWELYRRPYEPVVHHEITLLQDWHIIRRANLAELGANARQSVIDGYRQWVAQIPAYAEFVIGKK